MKTKLLRAAAVILCAAIIFSLAACSSGKIESKSDKLRVVCTLFVPYDFVREIAGDRVDLTLLLPTGMESHSYDPTPADMKAVSNADLLIRVGENMETWSAKLFDKSTGAGEYLDIASEMGLRLAAHEHEHEHGHEDEHEHEHEYEEGFVDAHIWTDPVYAQGMVKVITDALCRLDGRNAEFYKSNSEKYISKLQLLDAGFKDAVKNGKRDIIVFSGRFAFRNFTERYSLKFVSALDACADNSEPGARTVANGGDNLRRDGLFDAAVPLMPQCQPRRIRSGSRLSFADERQSPKSQGGTFMNKNILLACRDAVIGYDNTVAVNGVSFELERGDYLCIVGENGSGKSTLLKGILGLIPMRGGSVDFADGLRRTDIGYLPQQTQAQRDFPATVREVVLSGCLNGSKGPFYSRADRSLANKNMEKLSITNIANRSYRELSGGQQQRVLLARALCAAKELLLLDEPVTGLDPVVTAEFYRLIKKLNRDSGIAVIMVSHDIECAVENANKILHLGSRGVEFFGTTEDYLKSDAGRRFAGRGRSDV